MVLPGEGPRLQDILVDGPLDAPEVDGDGASALGQDAKPRLPQVLEPPAGLSGAVRIVGQRAAVHGLSAGDVLQRLDEHLFRADVEVVPPLEVLIDDDLVGRGRPMQSRSRARSGMTGVARAVEVELDQDEAPDLRPAAVVQLLVGGDGLLRDDLAIDDQLDEPRIGRRRA